MRIKRRIGFIQDPTDLHGSDELQSLVDAEFLLRGLYLSNQDSLSEAGQQRLNKVKNAVCTKIDKWLNSDEHEKNYRCGVCVPRSEPVKADEVVLTIEDAIFNPDAAEHGGWGFASEFGG